MTTSATNPRVDWFFDKDSRWQKEYVKLRQIILSCGLTEELKWGCPCYTFENTNIVLIHGFKEYCALLFFKGALLADPNGILIRQTENVQSARQIRFTGVQQITKMERTLKGYVYEAIEVERAGLKVDLKEKNKLVLPQEFQKKLKENPRLKTAFNTLTPGRQRAYNLYFSAAKQSKTRELRIEKYVQQIMNGKGLND